MTPENILLFTKSKHQIVQAISYLQQAQQEMRFMVQEQHSAWHIEIYGALQQEETELLILLDNINNILTNERTA